jgi:hypothetical protein
MVCFCADADDFSLSYVKKKILFGGLSCREKKKDACEVASVYFFQKSSIYKKFLS